MNDLTSNDMKPKFEIGDRVRYNELEGVIVGVDAESKRYSIQYEDDDDTYCVKEDWIEFANPRTTFLTRLQELLATFDAEIGVHKSSTIEGMPEGVMLTIYGTEPETRLFYNMPLVKGKDIFDYDKD